MIEFPVSIIDNFYNDPDTVREFALKQEYFGDEDGTYPGKRTACLSEINPDLYQETCERLLKTYYEFLYPIRWYITSQFHLVESLSPDQDSVLNRGWVHTDGGISSSIIYLNNEESTWGGTDIYKPISNDIDDSYHEARRDFYGKGIIAEDYRHQYNRHIRQYKKTVSVTNEYNRCISFSAKQHHAPASFYSTTPRLTQLIFIDKIEARSNTPLLR